jgi:hypothetical protein
MKNLPWTMWQAFKGSSTCHLHCLHLFMKEKTNEYDKGRMLKTFNLLTLNIIILSYSLIEKKY